MTDTTKNHSIWQRLYHGETSFSFVGRRRLWATISLALIVVGLLSLAVRGLNFGIDFRGGTSWEVETDELTVAEARDVLGEFGLADAKIQLIGGNVLRVQGDEANEKTREEVADALAEAGGVDRNDVSVNEVGPSWGEDISRKALRALIFFLVAITIYITLRFELKMAIATLTALFHDLFVTVGVYSLSGFEVTPATVIAVLTILGYSIYDGIVVFDKIDENTRSLASSGRMTYGDMVDLSLNQVLMRTLNTSITALLPILSLLIVGGRILGAVTLQDFALALLIGLAASAYSSIFIASPVLALLKEREPRYAAIKERLATGRPAGPLTPAAAAAASGGGSGSGSAPSSRVAVDDDDPASRGPSRPVSPMRRSGQPPRPRKKGRRR
ncbi:MAG TPA: protein translocase subunit SecF [Acidimicrobiales bacterium]|jgi:preprotein translocase subunit SecF|nr:protein translocase subunit SecF [Acidimicrobiales bacterium]